MSEESEEIIANVRQALADGEITLEQAAAVVGSVALAEMEWRME